MGKYLASMLPLTLLEIVFSSVMMVTLSISGRDAAMAEGRRIQQAGSANNAPATLRQRPPSLSLATTSSRGGRCTCTPAYRDARCGRSRGRRTFRHCVRSLTGTRCPLCNRDSGLSGLCRSKFALGFPVPSKEDWHAGFQTPRDAIPLKTIRIVGTTRVLSTNQRRDSGGRADWRAG